MLYQLERIKSFFEELRSKEKYEMNALSFWVGTKCTLRCRDCCNIIPYHSQTSFDIDLLISDLRKLLGICKINLLQIQGGEPFTHPQIKKLIQAINLIMLR